MKNVKLTKSPVVFDEDAHRYFLGDKELQGVTSTLVRRAFPDKYRDVNTETLAKAAEKGKELHRIIEFHDTFGTSAEEHEDPRIASYERLKEQYGMTTIANEYLVSDEEHYASSVDIVMLNGKGEICLIDVKTTYTLDQESTRLQLSIYRRFFERQNPRLKVASIYVIWLPNKDTSMAEMRQLKMVDDDTIDRLIEADLADESFDITESYGDLPEKLMSVEDEVIRIERMTKELKERQDVLEKGLYDTMSQYDVKSFKGQKIMITRVLPTVSESLDSKRLKEEMPDVYARYIKKSNRAGSLKITIL